MRNLDKSATEEFGIKGRKFVGLCGGGNNGGDRLVVTRKWLPYNWDMLKIWHVTKQVQSSYILLLGDILPDGF